MADRISIPERTAAESTGGARGGTRPGSVRRRSVAAESTAAASATPQAGTAIIGRSTVMTEMLALASVASGSSIPVLIEGETGVGKELVARFIHREGPRAGHPFVAINCASLPETLLEAELFGSCRGAYTGAETDRIGLFEAAGEGTIFLDEIGEIAPSAQVKLLRVLQESEILRLGENVPRAIRSRIVAATRCDLAQRVAERRFREDLLYRLAGFPILVPPLRSRGDDILVIAGHVLEAARIEAGRLKVAFDPTALAWLVAHPWPGNVRQLQNVIRKAVLLVPKEGTIRVEHLEHGGPPMPTRPVRGMAVVEPDADAAGPAGLPVDVGLSLRRARSQFEAQYLARILAESGGNVSRAARALGISRVWLHKKIIAYGIAPHARDPLERDAPGAPRRGR